MQKNVYHTVKVYKQQIASDFKKMQTKNVQAVFVECRLNVQFIVIFKENN